MSNTLLALALMALALLGLYDVIILRSFSHRGDSKANTLHAIEQANSPLYRDMVLADAMIDVVLADMLDNPNDIINR